MKKNPDYIPSRTSPRGSRRACLCKDRDTYAIECCDGSLWAQGIGAINRIAS
tara:strand:- start:114 stop:269 length:156 start_codon:yes stop_codon:yes gene_type:complete